MCPKKKNNNSERARGHDLAEKTENIRFVQLREEGSDG